jgi:hypothetical protein
MTTLRAISGVLRRLEYFGALRDRSGTYAHWGLERVHGDSAAKKAMLEAHKSLVSQVLSTPIKNLLADVEHSSELAGMEPETYLEQLSNAGTSLTPPEAGAGSGRHLNSVLHALLSLTRARRRSAIPPAA